MNKGENMKNNNGFTMIELVVSFSLMMIVIVYLLKTIVVISNKNQELLTLQEYEVLETTLLSKINEDIKNQNGNVEILEKNGSIFISGIEEYITFNNNENYITYKDIIYELPDGVKIADVPYTISNIKDGNMISSNTSFNVAKINLIVNNKDRKVIISNQYYDDTVEKKSCLYEAGKTWDFDYTGSEQSFIVPCSGNYKIELWGAQGGSSAGGRGGYTTGNIVLNNSTTLYVYVGSQPTTVTSGGYNGGGVANSDGRYRSGGGATDVRLTSGTWNNFDSLKSRIMVTAGGGGGYYCQSSADGNCLSDEYGISSGGDGGGLTGETGSRWVIGTDYMGHVLSGGGTQNSGGTAGQGLSVFGVKGSFGAGGNGSEFSAAGGGGYYGGGASGTNRDVAGTGAGGSSFISGHEGCDSITSTSTEDNIIHTGQSKHYSGLYFVDTLMIDGKGYSWTNLKGENIVGMPTHDGKSTMIGNSGNGYAKITYIGS